MLNKVLKNLNRIKEHDVVVTCADLHLSNNWSYGTYDEYGINSSLKYRRGAFNEAISVAEQLRAPLLFAGDLFDDRTIDHPTLYYACELLNTIKHSSIPKCVIIAGNHDKDLQDPKFTSISPFKFFFEMNSDSKISFISLRDIISIKLKKKRMRLFAIASQKNVEDSVTWAKEYIGRQKSINIEGVNEKDIYNVSLLHTPIDGAHLTKNSFYNGGVQKDVVDEMSKIFNWSICGDFHRHQLVRDNIYYCGSMTQLTRSEYACKCGYQVLDLSENKLYAYPCQGVPRFVKLNLEASGALTKQEKLKVVGRIVLAKVSCKDISQQVDVEAINKQILSSGAVYSYCDVVYPEKERDKKHKISSKLGTESIISKYVEKKVKDKVEREEIKNKGLKYYKRSI